MYSMYRCIFFLESIALSQTLLGTHARLYKLWWKCIRKVRYKGLTNLKARRKIIIISEDPLPKDTKSSTCGFKNWMRSFYAMNGCIPHAIVYGMHNVESIGIPHGHMIMSHDHVVCPFYHVLCLFEKEYQKIGIHIQYIPHLNTWFQLFKHQFIFWKMKSDEKCYKAIIA